MAPTVISRVERRGSKDCIKDTMSSTAVTAKVRTAWKLCKATSIKTRKHTPKARLITVLRPKDWDRRCSRAASIPITTSWRRRCRLRYNSLKKLRASRRNKSPGPEPTAPPTSSLKSKEGRNSRYSLSTSSLKDSRSARFSSSSCARTAS